MQNKKHKGLSIRKKTGYSFLSVYGVAAIIFLVFCIKVDMLPALYIGSITLVLTILGLLFALMHRRLTTSIIADILCVLLTFLCAAGCFYIDKMDLTISDISELETQTEVVSVYVMAEDSAQTINDAADYQFGRTVMVDKDNTDKTVEKIESILGKTLNIKEYDDMLEMLDDLKDNTIGAVVLNSSYAGIAADAEGYDWVSTQLRELTSVAHEVEIQNTQATPENVPETFIMYLSGIDTYGGISARSRSDVNILAVVNTRTKNILLLSTPRDSYVDFEATGGAKDKLTHAGIYGVEQSMDALERLYDIDIDYYLRINFTGFVDIIDALGGIEVYSEYDFSVQNIREYQRGYNQLTGLEALAFARERYSFAEGDYQRAKNQMEVIRAVIAKAASSSLLTNYNSVMNAVAGSFETNMPKDQISSLVKMQLSDMAQWNISSYTTAGQSQYAETYSMPGQQLYVIVLDENNIAEAERLINEVYDINDQSDDSNETTQ